MRGLRSYIPTTSGIVVHMHVGKKTANTAVSRLLLHYYRQFNYNYCLILSEAICDLQVQTIYQHWLNPFHSFLLVKIHLNTILNYNWNMSAP